MKQELFSGEFGSAAPRSTRPGPATKAHRAQAAGAPSSGGPAGSSLATLPSDTGMACSIVVKPELLSGEFTMKMRRPVTVKRERLTGEFGSAAPRSTRAGPATKAHQRQAAGAPSSGGSAGSSLSAMSKAKQRRIEGAPAPGGAAGTSLCMPPIAPPAPSAARGTSQLIAGLQLEGFWLRFSAWTSLRTCRALTAGGHSQRCACARSPWLRLGCTGDGGGACHGRATFVEPGCRVFASCTLSNDLHAGHVRKFASTSPKPRSTSPNRSHVLARRAVRGSFGFAPSTSLARTCGTHGLLPIGRWYPC